MRLFKVAHSLKSGLWFIPLLCVIAGVGMSFASIALDKANDFNLIPDTYTGGPDAAIQILTTVATSMVTLTTLVLTITMVVVQLAMGQFSPRIVQSILRDRPSQLAIGVFVATFAHAMLAMREVRSDPEPVVPGLAIVIAFLLVLVSIMVLVIYVHHIGRSLRVSALIELVGRQMRSRVEELYPDAGPPVESGDLRLVHASEPGVIFRVDQEKLAKAAEDANCRITLLAALGDFVPLGAPLFRIDGEGTPEDKVLHRNVALGPERTLNQDVAYGVRMLVDIAERSLADSPYEDPTTAVQAIDRIHDFLRQIARRPFPAGEFHDAAGELRFSMPMMQWEDYVRLAFDEIRLAGIQSPQVTRRLVSALDDLMSIAPDDRKPALQEQLDLISSGVGASDLEQRDSDVSLIPDRQGSGVPGRRS